MPRPHHLPTLPRVRRVVRLPCLLPVSARPRPPPGPALCPAPGYSSSGLLPHFLPPLLRAPPILRAPAQAPPRPRPHHLPALQRTRRVARLPAPCRSPPRLRPTSSWPRPCPAPITSPHCSALGGSRASLAAAQAASSASLAAKTLRPSWGRGAAGLRAERTPPRPSPAARRPSLRGHRSLLAGHPGESYRRSEGRRPPPQKFLLLTEGPRVGSAPGGGRSRSSEAGGPGRPHRPLGEFARVQMRRLGSGPERRGAAALRVWGGRRGQLPPWVPRDKLQSREPGRLRCAPGLCAPDPLPAPRGRPRSRLAHRCAPERSPAEVLFASTSSFGDPRPRRRGGEQGGS